MHKPNVSQLLAEAARHPLMSGSAFIIPLNNNTSQNTDELCRRNNYTGNTLLHKIILKLSI